MDDAHLKEEGTASEQLFKGNFLHAKRDTVRLPNGKSATREYIVHPGAVVVVPLLDDGRVAMVRQYRYPIDRVMTEFPAGKLDPGEDPLFCGQRELQEETGYTAREWAHAGAMHLAVAYSTEIIHIYFARGLTVGSQQLDHEEFVETTTATPAQLLDWCRDGTVSDAKTLTCTLWLQNVLSGAWVLDWQSTALPAGGR
jgi:ADP-ribose pyrophosphatase